jgi:hypothetical protein
MLTHDLGELVPLMRFITTHSPSSPSSGHFTYTSVAPRTATAFTFSASRSFFPE